MSALGVRNLAGYNEKIAEAARMGRPIPDPYWKPGDSMDVQHPVLEKLPYIVVLVDEFADLMMTVGKKVRADRASGAESARRGDSPGTGDAASVGRCDYWFN